MAKSAGRTNRHSEWFLLELAAAVYTIGLVSHTLDHIRRGTGLLTPEVFWAGMVSTVLGGVTVVLIFVRSRQAPRFAAVTGFPVAIGVAAVHFLPAWGALSDPFPGGELRGVTMGSWIVVSIEIAGAAALGFAGILALRRTLHRETISLK
jgi:hypothetical protein